jgi:hypothetical protein
MAIPPAFEGAVRRAVIGANCCGCHHVHLLEPPPSDGSIFPRNAPETDPSLSPAGMIDQGEPR